MNGLYFAAQRGWRHLPGRHLGRVHVTGQGLVLRAVRQPKEPFVSAPFFGKYSRSGGGDSTSTSQTGTGTGTPAAPTTTTTPSPAPAPRTARVAPASTPAPTSPRPSARPPREAKRRRERQRERERRNGGGRPRPVRPPRHRRTPRALRPRLLLRQPTDRHKPRVEAAQGGGPCMRQRK